MLRSRLTPLLLLTALSTLGNAQVTKKGGGYLLRAHYSKGLSISLASTNTVKGQGDGGKDLKVGIPISMKVLSVQNGLARVQIQLGVGKIGGQQISPAQSAVVELNDRNQGKVSATAANVVAPLPLKPVKIGQTWTQETPISTSVDPDGKMKVTYKFVGPHTVDGIPTVRLDYAIKGMAGGTGVMELRVSDGLLQSNVVTINLSGITMISSMKRK